MKQKLKKLKLLLTISLAGLLLNSCQEEFDDNYSESKNYNLVKEYSFKQASQKPKFNNAYHKFLNGLDKMKMTNKSTDSDFVIDSTTVKEITLGNQTTYTIAINRPTPSSNYFENLIVQVKTGDSTRAYIAKYTPNQEMVYYKEHDSYSFIGNSEIIEIAFDTSSFHNKGGTECITTQMCDYGGITHVAGEKCGTTYPQTNCVSSSSTGGGGYVPGYGAGSNSGTSTTDTPSGGDAYTGSVVTAPVIPVPKAEAPRKDPCPTLVPLMTEPNISNALNFLKTKVNGKSEFGYEIEKTYSTATDPMQLNTNLIAGNGSDTTIQVGEFIAGTAHNHTLHGGSIPSWSDIYWTMQCEEENSPRANGTAFNFVVVRDPQNPSAPPIIYALTINNLEDLQAQITLDFALPEVLEQEPMKDKIDYLLKIQASEFRNALTSNDLEKKFLEYFSKYGTNLSKFDPATNNWNNLRLQNPFNPNLPNTPNTVISEPCN